MINILRTPLVARLALLATLSAGVGACSSQAPKPDSKQALETDVKPEGEQKLATSEELTADVPSAADSQTQPAKAMKNQGDSAIPPGFASDLDSALQTAQQGDRDRAVEQLQGLVSDPQGGFLAAYNLGALYENEGEYARSAKRYSQALSKNPDFSPALHNLVRLYIRLGQPSDARKIARKYSESRPENMDHRAVALEVDIHDGKYEEVIRKAKQILRRDETNVEAMLVMAQANIELKRLELGGAILQRARELRPNRAEIYFKLGQIRVEQERMTDAIALFRRSIELSSDYPEAHNNLGILYHRAGDDQAASDEFSAAISDFPDYKQAYLNLGNSLKGLGQFSEAVASFKKALEIDAKYDKALFNLGVIHLDSEIEGIDKIARLNKALEFFDRYKLAAASKLAKGDPADKYIKEARKSIKDEKARQQMMRQAQMQVDENEPANDEDESNSGDE